jgi:hypothetical protein
MTQLAAQKFWDPHSYVGAEIQIFWDAMHLSTDKYRRFGTAQCLSLQAYQGQKK